MAKEFKATKTNNDADKKTEKKDYSRFIQKEKLKAEMDAIRDKAVLLQEFVGEEKTLPYGEKRLLGELFNIYCSAIDCLNALISIKG